MKRYALVIVLGPVQEFIRQARRTRDLWFGSKLLAELSERAADAVANRGGELVFPSRASASARTTADGNRPARVPNKIVAVINDDPRGAAEAARSAALTLLQRRASDAQGLAKELLANGIEDVWKEQIETLLEFYAAWRPFEVDEKFGEASAEADGAIAARKSLRDFAPWKHDRAGAPKSSLDGARVSVLKPKAERPPASLRKLRIEDAEQLDAVGVTKRAQQTGDEVFPPVANVALAAWTRNFDENDDAVKWMRQFCKENGVRRVSQEFGETARWKFDVQALLPGRLAGVLGESGERRPEETATLVGQAGKSLSSIWRRYGDPHPYACVLAADGDRMGQTLASPVFQTRQMRREFAGRIEQFADGVDEIVRRHLGALVYAGGDDVLALLPMPNAVACADALRRSFEAVVGNFARDHKAPVPLPTLSVGLGVGHLLEPLGAIIELAREAEHLAKGDDLPPDMRRNALGMIIDKRSGGTLRWRCGWQDDPAARLEQDRALLAERLSGKKLHELIGGLRRLRPRGVAPDDATTDWANIIYMDLCRTLRRTDVGGTVFPEELGLEHPSRQESATAYADEVERILDRLLIAVELRRAAVRAPETQAKAATS